MNSNPSKTKSRKDEGEGLDGAYYALVRVLDYTWAEVLEEKVPQTMYSFTRLEEESEDRKEQQEETEKQYEKMNSKTGGRI